MLIEISSPACPIRLAPRDFMPRTMIDINPSHVGTFIAREAVSSCVQDGRLARNADQTKPLGVVAVIPGGSGSEAAARSVKVV